MFRALKIISLNEFSCHGDTFGGGKFCFPMAQHFHIMFYETMKRLYKKFLKENFCFSKRTFLSFLKRREGGQKGTQHLETSQSWGLTQVSWWEASILLNSIWNMGPSLRSASKITMTFLFLAMLCSF